MLKNKIKFILVALLLSATSLLIYHSPSKVEAAGELNITFPESSISAEPNVATRTIHDENNDFTIPYIQTESTLSPTATVDASKVPAGGGLKFVIDEGLPGEIVKYDMTAPSPYTVTFTNLPKAEHTLDVYVVNSSQVVQSGVDKHDGLTRVGIGDIIAALGDSITAGFTGSSNDLGEVSNWTEAAPGEISLDKRNFAQSDPFSLEYMLGSMPQLNNQLTTSHGYPVFIMNEGVGGLDAGTLAFNITPGSPVPLASQISRLTDLKPNKWIVHLGVNDARGDWPVNEYLDRMGWIPDSLITNYGADPEDIFIAKPLAIDVNWSAPLNAVEADYSSELDTLISNDKLMNGPDYFKLYNDNNPAYYAVGSGQPFFHPSVAGYSAMADLQTLTFAHPENIDIAFDSGNYTVAWDNLAAKHSEVSGYEVRYGTDPNAYQTVDVGTDLDYTITDITGADQGKQLKVFVRALYDNTVSDYIAKSDWSDVSSIWVDGVPSKPLNVSAVAGNKQATVSFDAPESNGNHTITHYVVTSSPDDITATGSSSPIVVSGLVNGTTYTFTVKAVNSEGDSPDSDPSGEVSFPPQKDSSVLIDVQNPDDFVKDKTIHIDALVTNYGYDDLHLSEFNGTDGKVLAAVVYPIDLLTFESIDTPDVNCIDLGKVADSNAASILTSHSDYGAVMCLYTGGVVLAPDESFLVTLNFTVKKTPTSSFNIFAFNLGNTNEPNQDTILFLLNSGFDYIDATLFLEINNTSQYSFVLGDQTGGGGDNGTDPNPKSTGALEKTGQYIASQKLLSVVVVGCAIAIVYIRRRKA